MASWNVVVAVMQENMGTSVKDPLIYTAAALFLGYINAILCLQRVVDRQSRTGEKLRSLCLYTLMLVILFALPFRFGERWELLVAGTIVGYIHFFYDRPVMRR